MGNYCDECGDEIIDGECLCGLPPTNDETEYTDCPDEYNWDENE